MWIRVEVHANHMAATCTIRCCMSTAAGRQRGGTTFYLAHGRRG